MITMRRDWSMSPERDKNVVQPGTFITMCEKVRLIWTSNTTGVLVFLSVKSLCSAEPITKDAQEAHE